MSLPDPFSELIQHYSDEFSLILDHLKGNFTTFANTYFNQNRAPANHDAFFNRFTPVWMDLLRQRKYYQATTLWKYALDLAFNWQRLNRPNKIHKGTPYYFLGVTSILNNELENGFLAMHQALKEDYRLSGRGIPQTPAFWFATLDSTRQQQFFKSEVDQVSTYLSEKLEDYRSSRGGTLRLPDFRNRFLRRRTLTNEVFFFVYLLFSLRKLEIEAQLYKKNSFSSIIYTRLLFNMCRTLERVIENKNPARGSGFIGFKNEIVFLSRPSRGIPSLSFTSNQLGTLNRRFNNDFSRTMYDILKGRYPRTLSGPEKDFACAYGIRNLGAHEIRNFPVIYNRFPELAQNIINALFLVIERLY